MNSNCDSIFGMNQVAINLLRLCSLKSLNSYEAQEQDVKCGAACWTSPIQSWKLNQTVLNQNHIFCLWYAGFIFLDPLSKFYSV
jgi:hypothetical protein